MRRWIQPVRGVPAAADEDTRHLVGEWLIRGVVIIALKAPESEPERAGRGLSVPRAFIGMVHRTKCIFEFRTEANRGRGDVSRCIQKLSLVGDYEEFNRVF